MSRNNFINLYETLNSKFTRNFERWKVAHSDDLESIELKCRALGIWRSILEKEIPGTNNEHDILNIFDEVFSDLVLSIYLSSCGLDNPAQIVLRRSLELGVAAVYLWDNPVRFYSWQKHDEDLRFSEMVEAIWSPVYLAYLKSRHKVDCRNVERQSLDRLYRELSNTTHGKPATFESQLEDRYTYTEADAVRHFDMVGRVQDVLLTLWANRFQNRVAELEASLPALRVKLRGGC
jgi:hypothetical protein